MDKGIRQILACEAISQEYERYDRQRACRLEDEHNENDADCEIDRVIDQS